MKTILKLMLAAGALIGYSASFAASVDVDTCTPTTGSLTPDQYVATGTDASQINGNDCWTLNDTNNTDLASYFTNPDLYLAYKEEYNDGVFGGSEGSGFDVSLSAGGGSASDPDTITITSDGTFDCTADGSCYVVIKDGSVADPSQYIFDISGWDGTNPLTFTDVFAGQGSISNVAIWANDMQVPEPMTLLLLGAGLVGFGLRRRLVQA